MINNGSRKLRVLACQHGARRRYAIPRMLEQAGLLAALYTDSSAYSILGKWAALFGGRAPQVMKRLAGRKIRGIPTAKIFSSDAYTILEFGQKLIQMQKRGLPLFRQRDRILSRRMKKWGLQDANIVYSMYHENPDFTRWAKAQGLRSVVDVFISPQTHEIMAAEFADFPDWGDAPDATTIRTEEQMWKETAGLADVLVCPSEWVAQGVRALSPEAADKIRIVPYGCSINYAGQINQPEPGRILFVGGHALRKGLHYLAQAVTRLKSSNPEIDVRIAGMLPLEVVNHPICKDLNFLGKLDSEQLKTEFLSADCFVLPSLSEGFAGVVAEAIGAGCPVIVTPETGSPIEDGREGLMIPARNVMALTKAMNRMITDRDFRTGCASACLQRATFYSEAVWRERLIPVIMECADSMEHPEACRNGRKGRSG